MSLASYRTALSCDLNYSRCLGKLQILLPTLSQPVVGFQVLSVHSIPVLALAMFYFLWLRLRHIDFHSNSLSPLTVAV